MALVRRAPQLLAVGVVALAPFLAVVLRLPVPVDVDAAKGELRTVWLVLPLVWIAQLALARAAVAVRDPALGPIAALRAAARGLATAAIPCALAFVAIAIGLGAAVIPGVILLVLFAFTGAVGGDAFTALPASAARARGHLARAAIVVGVALVVDAAIVFAAQRFALAIPQKPAPAQLATFVTFARLACLGLAIVTPVVASALAIVSRE